MNTKPDPWDEQAVTRWYDTHVPNGTPNDRLYRKVVTFIDKTKQQISPTLRTKAIKDGRNYGASPTVLHRIDSANRTIKHGLKQYHAQALIKQIQETDTPTPRSIKTACQPIILNKTTRPQITKELLHLKQRLTPHLQQAQLIAATPNTTPPGGQIDPDGHTLEGLLELIAEQELHVTTGDIKKWANACIEAAQTLNQRLTELTTHL